MRSGPNGAEEIEQRRIDEILSRQVHDCGPPGVSQESRRVALARRESQDRSLRAQVLVRLGWDLMIARSALQQQETVSGHRLFQALSVREVRKQMNEIVDVELPEDLRVT